MTPTADPVIRLRRYRHCTLAGGIVAACAAGTWAILPQPAPADSGRTAPQAGVAQEDRLVHPEHWRVALAPIAAPAPAAPQEAPVPITLITIMSSGGERRAMLKIGDGRMATVAVGGASEGWTVVAIDERSVTLDKGGAKRVVEMRR